MTPTATTPPTTQPAERDFSPLPYCGAAFLVAGIALAFFALKVYPPGQRDVSRN
jgi:hypothetical protein